MRQIPLHIERGTSPNDWVARATILSQADRLGKTQRPFNLRVLGKGRHRGPTRRCPLMTHVVRFTPKSRHCSASGEMDAQPWAISDVPPSPQKLTYPASELTSVTVLIGPVSSRA